MPATLAQADREAIADGVRRLAAATLTLDAEARAALYAEDGILMPTDAPEVQGRAAIAAYLKQRWAPLPPFVSFDVQPREVEGIGDMVYVRGSYRGVRGEEVIVGKYLSIWKKQPDGTWLMHRDIFNRDAES